MPRVLWKGAISFGLVNIPVGLYSAEKRNELSFTMLDRRDMSPVGYNRINKETGKDVPWDQIVKGYEYEEGKYAVMSDEDFRAANVRATQTVDILSFVEAQEIPFTLFETPYYLAPDKRGEKGYALLREIMQRARKLAITQVVIRTRQYLAAMIPLGNMLVLNTLRYPDEMKPGKDLDVPGELKGMKVNEREIDMAMKLVEEMTEPWKPSQYHDTYREDILARVHEKIKAGETETITEANTEKAQPRSAQVIDLMALLKRSVEQKGRKHDDDSENKSSGAAAKNAPRAPARKPSATGKAGAAPRRAGKGVSATKKAGTAKDTSKAASGQQRKRA